MTHKEKKTVLLVTPYFPPHSGGLERYVHEIAHNLDSGTWNIEVLTTSEDGADMAEKHAGYRVHRLRYGLKVSNTPFSLLWFFKARKLVQNIHPDIVNIHMPVAGLGDVVAWVLPRKVPLVVTYHGDSMQKGSFLADLVILLYEKVLLPYLLHRATRIVCSSETVRKGFLKRYLYKSCTVLPAVSTNIFFPNRDVREDTPTVLFVAGLGKGEEHKGLTTLLHAFAIVRRNVDTARLSIVGDGDRRQYYESLSDDLGIGDAVTFRGKLDGKELVREYQRAHLLVLPTENESFGMVIAEAMACGLPVISTRVGGVPFLVDDRKTGILLEPGDCDGFAKEIIGLLEDDQRAYAYGNAGREKVLQGFSWQSRASSFEQVYESVLQEPYKLAYIVGYYPPHLGGMEVVAEAIAKEFAERGIQVRVFTSDRGAAVEPKTFIKTNFLLKRLRSFDVAHTPILWTLPFRLLMLPGNTILHVHLAQVGIPEIALLISKIRRFPIIMHFHLDVEPSGRLGRAYIFYKKHILGRILRSATAVLVFSEEQKRFVMNTYGLSSQNVWIIPNGISSEYFKREHERCAKPTRLLFVGRLTVQKRVDRLIEAFTLLRIPAELTIVGDGEDRKQLERLARGVKNVTFVGAKLPNEVRAFHDRSDVFITASDKEGMPMTVLEAMAAGLPVIAPPVMGLEELVTGVGKVARDVSPQALASAVEELAGDVAGYKAMSARSVAYAKKHTWTRVAVMLENVYTHMKTI